MAETCNGKRVDVKLNGQVCSIRLKYVSNEAFRPEELMLRARAIHAALLPARCANAGLH